MANTNPVSFLLNQSDQAKTTQVVDAPAFSLTKFLSAAAIIVTPIAALVVNQAKSVTLSAGNFVALTAAVLAFLAIASAADVLGRSYASAVETKAQVALAATAELITFEQPLDGHRICDGPDVAIRILATANTGEPMFLVNENDAISWLSIKKVTIP
jgi:hypothetical protein